HTEPRMGIDLAHYHGWQGKLQSPWMATLALVRVALLQVFRRKMYWVILAIGLLQFLQFFSIIFGITQLKLPEQMQNRLLLNFGFSAVPEPGQENGYTIFIVRQSVVVVILLAFAGSTIVGSDFHQKT